MSSQANRAAAAAFIGTTIEWYDFYIYATASALVFGDLFFPASDEYVATMASFATFAVGFVARPVGAMLFGHIGDRIGRKTALLITLALMGVATVGIGLLPTANTASFAPALLVALRLAQGVAVGGEWGGAVLIAGEHAPSGRRTFFASFAQLGSPAGLILSMLAFRAVASLDNDALLSWGWRIPFLASAVLLAVGFFIRVGISESPEFEEARKRRSPSDRHPLLTVLAEYKTELVLCIAANTLGIAGFYFTNTYMLSYTTKDLGLDRTLVLDAFLAVAVIQFIAQPLAASLGERIGTARVLRLAAALAAVSPYLMFLLADTRNLFLVTLGVALPVICMGSFYSVIAGFVSNVFTTAVRYSGISLAYQFCGVILGGLTPLTATWIAHGSPDEWWPLAAFYSLLAGLSFMGVVLLDRQTRTSIAHADLLSP